MYTTTTLFSYLRTLLLPTTCTLCKKEGVTLCAECVSSLPVCKEHEVIFLEKVFVLLSYRDARVKRILHDAKYHHQKRLYEPLIEALVQKFPSLLSLSKTSTLIIPVPVHPLRSFFRGQNHTKSLAFFLSEKTKLSYNASLLFKKKRTKRQALLSKKERLTAQKNSFAVRVGKKSLLEGKDILLIDDILTTGSTLQEAKEVLLSSGAKSVDLLALAH